MQWLIDLVIEAIGIPPVYIWRGDWADADFSTLNFTQDNNWHELDLSAIVPAGATAVNVHIKGKTPTITNFIRLRRHGSTSVGYTCLLRPQVANHWVGGLYAVAVDTDRKIDYYFNGVDMALQLTVHGWWL